MLSVHIQIDNMLLQNHYFIYNFEVLKDHNII